MLVVCNDPQLYRNCDEEALGAFLKFVDFYKKHITHFVFNGDISDFEQQSNFPKNEDQMHSRAEEEISATKWLLEYIAKKLPHAQKIFNHGNHDMPRWENMLKNQTNGVKAWLKTPSEMFKFKELGYKEIGYGRGQFYRWHDRVFWHGHRSGKKSNIPKLELEDALGLSVTTAHINKNMYYEEREITGKLRTGIVHGGFSKDNLGFVKDANSKWSQGFGVYFWHPKVGEQVYSVVINHGKPRFIWEGKLFDGKGFKIPV